MMRGALEAGGTKMVCAVFDEFDNVVQRAVIPTGMPESTMAEMLAFYKRYGIEALGVGCFGPIDLNRESVTYGRILSTPKLAWRNYDILGEFKKGLGCSVSIDTDVNVACLGEVLYGAAKGCKNVAYITIGTGVGIGVYSEGKLLHGTMHPEAGHMLVRRVEGDVFHGICPYHKDCLEGLVSGPSLEARCGRKAYEIARDDLAWEYTTTYIAEGISNLILMLAPEKIILGGGVMEQEWMMPVIHAKVKEAIHGYVELKGMEQFIVRPGCKGEQGILGALSLVKLEKKSI